MSNRDGELKLLLNLHQCSQTLEECWMEGFHQANLEMSEEVNPYTSGSREADHWSQGWWAGFYGEEALYPEYAVGVPAALEDAAIERCLEESDIATPSPRCVTTFLVALGTTAGACVLATSLLI